jgi:hypothetical protein
MKKKIADNINPQHYKSHPSGVEAIAITEHMNFCLGNALKYIWRADLKHNDGGVEDLKKAKWYIEREIARITKATTPMGFRDLKVNPTRER